MRNDVVLGISIDAGEILSVIIDGNSGELLAQNRIPFTQDTDLVGTIDRLIRSAPETIDSVGIACADPAIRIALDQARRRTTPQTDDDDEDAVPGWLLAASITSVATAVAVIAARQFAGMSKVLVVNVDSAGHTAAVQPMVLVDPLTESVVDTATLPFGTPPVQEMAGSTAVANSMNKLPGRGRDVEMIASAGAGSEIPHLASTLGAATGLAVQPIEHGEFAVAHGAAALTKSNKVAPPVAAAGGAGKKRTMLLAGAAGLAVSAALIGGSAYLIKNGGSESPRKADVVAPFSTSVSSPTKTQTPSSVPKSTSPSRAPSSTTAVTPTTTEVAEVTLETVVVETTTTRRPVPNPRIPTGNSERPPAPNLPDYTPPSRPSETSPSSQPPVSPPNSSTAPPR